MAANIDPINQKICNEKGLNSTSFENYTDTSNNYDNTRIPVGVDIYYSIFSDIQSKKICDIGCGTGNYLLPFSDKCKYMCGIDLNKSMLEKTKNKIKKELIQNNTVELIHASMTKIPKENNEFNYVMLNQCIHHLPYDDEYKLLYETLHEVNRILVKDGLCIINTTTAEQQEKGFWWAPIIENAIKDVQKRFPVKKYNDSKFIASVEKIGFELVSQRVVNEPLQGKEYYNINGPFEKIYRDGDSTWKLSSNSDLQNGLEIHRNRINNNSIKDWINERELLRKEYGQSIFLVFKKI